MKFSVMSYTEYKREFTQSPWSALYLLASSLFLLALLYNHYQIIVTPVPIDYFEGGMLVTTDLISKGENPYVFDKQPVFTCVYPPIYNIIVAPFSLVFGNSLQLHRLIAGLFILGSCSLCYLLTLRASQSKLHSFTAATIFYAALLFYSTPTASTNSTGQFFFLLSLALPWLFNYSRASLACALLCGIIAFYSKQYFIVGQAYLCLYLFLAVSKKTALQYGFSLVAVLLISIFLVHITSPYYFNNTVFLVSSSVSMISSTEKVISQLQEFVLNYMALLLLLLIIAVDRLRRNTNNKLTTPVSLFDFRNMNSALLKIKVDYFWLCFLCSSLVIIFILGKNPGNHMTYLYQLMSPFLLIAGFTAIAKFNRFQFICIPLILVCLYQSYDILPKDFNITNKNWAKVDRLIVDNEHILASPILMDKLLDHNKTFYQGAGTVFFRLSTLKPEVFKKSNPAKTAEGIWEQYTANLWHRIEQEKFDVILLTPWNVGSTIVGNPPHGLSKKEARALFKQHYEKTTVIPVSLTERLGGGTQELGVWKPKRN